MARFLLLLTIFCAAFGSSVETFGQHFLSTNGKAIVNENQDTILLRGMGLGGWMVQEGYMLQTASFANPQHQIRAKIQELIGETATEEFYEAWLANHVTRADIDSLKAWGFNSVRLPMHYNLYTLPIEEEPVAGQQTWLDTGFELTDSLISWCAQKEMYVILDLHAAPGGQGYDEGISDYDPNKPSLWESPANRAKMVALWGRLAERYADEQWVAGYDILNEPNWNLPGGTALKSLYVQVTNAIRAVDTQHILFIEGNWFANDFTGLTPPWDDNFVYAPHKYWSYNDRSSIQSFLDLRDTYNVPLYLGESGENSNEWFRDAIRLLEDEGIGWAWWPMKKIESVAGPLSVVKTPGYQVLLDYWNGDGPAPTASEATATLMDLTEKLKAENCVFRKGVVDAMFRQVYSDETLPYDGAQSIPGIVYATEYDLGRVGEAYFDTEVANYHVSTGEYTAWNNGWTFRNDGVDIERCFDGINTNGYLVGWTATGEWMKYTVDVAETGVYDIQIRRASGGNGGSVHFRAGNSELTSSYYLPPTNGWQSWQTTIVPDVILHEDDTELYFYVDQGGFNVSSFKFVNTGTDPASLPMEFVAASTIDETSIRLNTNKRMATPLPDVLSDFEIFVNGSSYAIEQVSIDPEDARILIFELADLLTYNDVIRISYSGTQITAEDGSPLGTFSLEEVTNNLEFVHLLPTRIEAEDYHDQTGVSLENTSDTGGGQNIAFLDPGDYLDYEVSIPTAGAYTVDYRTASEWGNGQVRLELLHDNGSAIELGTHDFVATGGWQSWTTSTETVDLPQGRYTLRMTILQSPFNMNWMEFSLITVSTDDPNDNAPAQLSVFPNPANDRFTVRAAVPQAQAALLNCYDATGRVVWSRQLAPATEFLESVDLSGLPGGLYLVRMEFAEGGTATRRVVLFGE